MYRLFQTLFLKEKAIILILYFLLAATFSPYYRYYIHLADTFQYLRIAEDYVAGNFAEAVNSYWSPLFSWLLALFFKIGVEPFLAIQLLQVILGSITLFGIMLLMPFKHGNKISHLFFYFSFLTLILSFALLVATPDLLLLTIGVWYLIFIIKPGIYLTKKYSFLLLGLFGALLYFAKGAGLIFFLFSFSLINAICFYRNRSDRKHILIKYASTIITFLIFASFWIIPISAKENKLLFSSAPAYNFKLIGPVSNPIILGELHHPYEWLGLILPPQSHSINAWEEPQKLKLDAWSPLTSKKNFLHYLKIILKNLWSIQSFYFGMDAGTIMLLGILFLLIKRKVNIYDFIAENSIPIIIAISCTLPYIFVFVAYRHIWLDGIVIGLLATKVFHIIYQYKKNISTLFLLFFSVLMIVNPAKELLTTYKNYTNIFAENKELQKCITGNTASTLTDNEIGGENYTKSTMVSYLSHNKYFGMVCVPKQEITIKNEFKRYKIKSLLSWNDNFTMPDSLYFDCVKFPQIGVAIYRLK